MDGALRMNPSQLVDVVFKVYGAQEARKIKQATVFLETGGETRRRGRNLRTKRSTLGINVPIAREGPMEKGLPKTEKREQG